MWERRAAIRLAREVAIKFNNDVEGQSAFASKSDRRTAAPTGIKLVPSISIKPDNRRAWLAIFVKSYSSAFQISVAYSRMVRSEENQPIREVFNTAERHHA